VDCGILSLAGGERSSTGALSAVTLVSATQRNFNLAIFTESETAGGKVGQTSRLSHLAGSSLALESSEDRARVMRLVGSKVGAVRKGDRS